MIDLIKRLRDEPKYNEQLNGLNPFEMNVWHNTACEAADALEQAQARIDELEGALIDPTSTCPECHDTRKTVINKFVGVEDCPVCTQALGKDT